MSIWGGNHMAFCSNCGTKIIEGGKFCVSCGKSVEAELAHEKIYQKQLSEEIIEEKNDLDISEVESEIVDEELKIPKVELNTLESNVEMPKVGMETLEEKEKVLEVGAETLEANTETSEVGTEIPETEAEILEVGLESQDSNLNTSEVGTDVSEVELEMPEVEKETSEKKPEISEEPIVEEYIETVSKSEAVPQSIEKSKKKSKKRVLIPLLLILILIIVSAAIIIYLSIEKKDIIDLDQFATVEYQGMNGEGEANVYFNIYEFGLELDEMKEDTDIFDRISEIFGRKEIDQIGAIELLNSITVSVSPEEDLSNGDKVTVYFEYDQNLASEYGLKFQSVDQEYTVKDLDSYIEVDPFKDIIVTFSGVEPFASVQYENNSEDHIIESLYYEFENYDMLKEGDTVTLFLSEDEIEYAQEYGYLLTKTFQEYDVKGLDSYISTLEDISEDDLETLLERALIQIQEDYTDLEDYGTLSEIEFAGTYFLAGNSGDSYPHNTIFIIYTALISSPNQEFVDTMIYIPVKIDNMINASEEGFISDEYLEIWGEITLENYDYSLKGYVSQEIMYQEIMNELSKDYEIWISEELTDFSQ